MAKVPVKHSDITSDDAKKAPKREPIPIGRYHAVTMKVNQGITGHKPEPFAKISVEFQIVAMIGEDGELDESHKGRRVYQDYILEPDEMRPDLSEQWRYELVQLLDACDAEFDEDGFDDDDIKQKRVIISIRHRQGDKTDEDGNTIVFTNVKKVESAEEVSEDDLI